ncbi:hypothetical protein PHMEG_00027464 [Phytophthora megakarya]|uniref:Uncharacterized protein n=1 Tax=Phytophthora megakarya TaxID=4795 RepID=A0A225V7B3_9STRA|nr:hypothetical protein PHMEG_00027464 [Phytophthora megakarya]
MEPLEEKAPPVVKVEQEVQDLTADDSVPESESKKIVRRTVVRVKSEPTSVPGAAELGLAARATTGPAAPESAKRTCWRKPTSHTKCTAGSKFPLDESFHPKWSCLDNKDEAWIFELRPERRGFGRVQDLAAIQVPVTLLEARQTHAVNVGLDQIRFVTETIQCLFAVEFIEWKKLTTGVFCEVTPEDYSHGTTSGTQDSSRESSASSMMSIPEGQVRAYAGTNMVMSIQAGEVQNVEGNMGMYLSRVVIPEFSKAVDQDDVDMAGEDDSPAPESGASEWFQNERDKWVKPPVFIQTFENFIVWIRGGSSRHDHNTKPKLDARLVVDRQLQSAIRGVEALAGRLVDMESRRQRAETTSSVMAEQVKVEGQPPASLDTERTQDRVKKDVEEATRRERERFQAEYEQRWRQHMVEVEQERVRWTAEATRTLGAQQEVLAAERASLQQQFQDLRATVAALLHPDATTDSKSNVIGDADSATQKSSVTSAIKGDARDCPVYAPVKDLTEVALSQLRATLPEVKDEPRTIQIRRLWIDEVSIGKEGFNQVWKSSTRKAKEDSGSPPSDPGDDSDSSSDDGGNSDSSSSGSEDSLDNDDGSGTAAAKTTKDDWYAQLPMSTRHNWKLLTTKFRKLYCRTTGSYAERYFTMKMRSSETALQFFYRLNAAAVKAEIPF